MLHNFLEDNRVAILALAKAKIVETGPSRIQSDELDRGLPIFYVHLIAVLKRVAAGDTIGHYQLGEETSDAAERYGREAERLGYSVSQVVHTYGALCQSITEYAHDHRQEITPKEFHGFNFTLDAAIAEAVTEFFDVSERAKDANFDAQIGSLAHELRNPISNAIMALEAIRLGHVGVGGSTGQLLDRALQRMKELVERALDTSRSTREVHIGRVNLREVMDEVADAAKYNSQARSIALHIDVSGNINLDADPQQLTSAISNLVQNAVKFTKSSTSVWVRATRSNDRVLIEVEDRCGGLPPGAADNIFKPYVQKDDNKSGVGLGLFICRKAVDAHHGAVSVRDLPGVGCIFSIDLPETFLRDNESSATIGSSRTKSGSSMERSEH